MLTVGLPVKGERLVLAAARVAMETLDAWLLLRDAPVGAAAVRGLLLPRPKILP